MAEFTFMKKKKQFKGKSQRILKEKNSESILFLYFCFSCDHHLLKLKLWFWILGINKITVFPSSFSPNTFFLLIHYNVLGLRCALF